MYKTSLTCIRDFTEIFLLAVCFAGTKDGVCGGKVSVLLCGCDVSLYVCWLYLRYTYYNNLNLLVVVYNKIVSAT